MTCNKPKPFYGFDLASLEAFVFVQYPSDIPYFKNNLS